MLTREMVERRTNFFGDKYTTEYTYDDNGNLNSRQEKGMTGNFRNFNYSSENQLIGIDFYENSIQTKEVQYKYDALGRRTKKIVIDNQDATKSFEKKYIYDGQEILAELDASDSTLAVFTHSTLRTDDVLAVDVKDIKVATTGSYFYLKDALGSVIDIVDSSGNLIQHYAYSSFGKIVKISDRSGNDVSASPPVKTSYGFTNREHDSESGMMYYRARYYAPEIGRFIQEDPNPGKIIKPMTANNRYAYAGNNPTMNIDPNGEFFITAMIVGAVIGGIMAHMSGDNILEGILIGAVAGATGGWAAGGVTATGAMGAFVGSVVGATVGALTGGLTGGLLSTLSGGSFSDGMARGVQIGAVAGGAGGSINGWFPGKDADPAIWGKLMSGVDKYWAIATSKKAFLAYSVPIFWTNVGDLACGGGKIYDANKSNEDGSDGGCIEGERPYSINIKFKAIFSYHLIKCKLYYKQYKI
jgi:RHS repeat-associated protein